MRVKYGRISRISFLKFEAKIRNNYELRMIYFDLFLIFHAARKAEKAALD